MQTFLPHADYKQSAAALDNQRLGKQRVEVLQILKAIHDPKYGWQHHPVVRMWRPYAQSLVQYGEAICAEWKRRGYKDTTLEQIIAFRQQHIRATPPPFLGNEAFHASHRSRLLQKNPSWYGRLGWTEEPGRPYVWPIGRHNTNNNH